MEAIKFILVILLCIPMAFLLLFFINSLIISIRRQQEKAERIRRNKAMFQSNSLSNEESDYSENMRLLAAKRKRKRRIQLNFGKIKEDVEEAEEGEEHEIR